MGWLYVPGLEGSSLASGSPSDDDTAVWVTSSGTPMQQPLSWRGWSMRRWIRRLFGTICHPSTADRGAASWISSLRASRASLLASPASSSDTTTRDGCGLMSSEWFARRDPGSSFWRTSQVCLFGGWETYSATWPTSGSMRRGVCSRLPPVEHLTSAGGSSYSVPTPIVSSCTNQRDGHGSRIRRLSLRGMALHGMWPTPSTAMTAGYSSDEARSRRTSGGHRAGHRGNELLRQVHAERWPTPRSRDWKGGGKDCLDRAVVPTPTKADATSGPGSSGREGGENLRTSVGGQLNPTWVEWLMGLPIGWTDCAALETESFQQWLREHSSS